MTDSPLLRLHPHDNVLVAKTPIALGETIAEFGVRARRFPRATRSRRVPSRPASR
jgi:hypothetical protein